VNIRVQKEGDRTVIFLGGSVDIPDAQPLGRAFDEVLESDAKRVVVDFGGARFIGSSGIGKLLLFHHKLVEERGGAMELASMSNYIRTLFKSMRLDQLFKL
jgi:anti-sigma B factor antagonist